MLFHVNPATLATISLLFLHSSDNFSSSRFFSLLISHCEKCHSLPTPMSFLSPSLPGMEGFLGKHN